MPSLRPRSSRRPSSRSSILNPDFTPRSHVSRSLLMSHLSQISWYLLSYYTLFASHAAGNAAKARSF